MNFRPKALRLNALGSHIPATMALEQDSAAEAYAVPRLPAPMMRMRGGVGKVWRVGVVRKGVSMEEEGEGMVVGDVVEVLNLGVIEDGGRRRRGVRYESLLDIFEKFPFRQEDLVYSLFRFSDTLQPGCLFCVLYSLCASLANSNPIALSIPRRTGD